MIQVRLRAVLRLLRCGLHVLRGMLTCAVVFPFIDAPRRMAHVGRWSALALTVLGIELREAPWFRAIPTSVLVHDRDSATVTRTDAEFLGLGVGHEAWILPLD